MVSSRLVGFAAVASSYLLVGCDIDRLADGEDESSSIGDDTAALSRGDEPGFRQEVFTNPVLPGDHPDMNIYVEGDDFYLTGSSFNMAPYVEILHSRDLIHWEPVSRVVSSSWSGVEGQIAGQGTWGGFIVKLPDGYRVYFAVNFNQFFAEAPTLEGPWSDPIRLNSFPYTVPGGEATFQRGNGYDDSVFVDDDGKTYLLIKAGQCKWNGLTDGAQNNFGINLITEIDPVTGMLKEGTTLDLSFVNWNTANGGCGDPQNDPDNAETSHWAEGPTMVKRNGIYYYFVSTHTGCGGEQYVWSSPTLSGNPDDWTPLGRFLEQSPPFSGTQHSTAPVQIADGTWWAFFHSYECTGGWQGLARQGLLRQVTWTDDGVPVVVNGDGVSPAPAPGLPKSGIPFLVSRNDEFDRPELATGWSFYGFTPAERTSLTDRPGWLRVLPEPGQSTFVVQRETLHANAIVTRLDFQPQGPGDAAGIRIGNPVPAEHVARFDSWTNASSIEVSVARVWDSGDKIRFALGPFSLTSTPAPTTSVVVPAPAARTVWLKIERAAHQATGWFSTDRRTWTQVGGPVDISALDNYDSLVDGWVGNQAGVFASNRPADFDLFTYRDGFAAIPASEPNQRSGGGAMASAVHGAVLGGLVDDDWALFGGVDLGSGGVRAKAVELTVARAAGRRATIEVWLDDPVAGRRIAACPVPVTGSWDTWQTVRCSLRASGTHDVYLKVRGRGSDEVVRVASMRFAPERADEDCDRLHD